MTSARAIGSETVLITGGTGFVGSWTIVAALQAGYRVRATVRTLKREAELRAAIATQIDAGDRLTIVEADLTADGGWDEAVAGCDYVLHVASDMGGTDGDTPVTKLLEPARDGTVRVIRASIRAKVRRVVMTSAALTTFPAVFTESTVLDESNWADVSQPGMMGYTQSKILAERAAWDEINRQTGDAATRTTLTAILPALIVGPILAPRIPVREQLVTVLLRGKVPVIPRIGFNIVDVRDCAAVHLKAMVSPAAAGQRYLVASEHMWFREIAALLRERLGKEASKVPTRVLWDWVVRIAAWFSSTAKVVAQLLGVRVKLNISKAEAQLGFHKSRSAAQSILDCSDSLIKLGVL